MKKVIAYLFFLVVLGVFCLYAVIAIRPPEGGATRLTEVEEPDVIMTHEGADLGQLSRLFDHAFPVMPDAGAYGKVSTRRLEGRNARLLELDYAQMSISCVWPANAAPLLLVPDLTLMSLYSEERYRFSILSMPAIYAEKDGRRCLYFSDESAAYRMYTDTLSRNEFLIAAQRLAWYRQGM